MADETPEEEPRRRPSAPPLEFLRPGETQVPQQEQGSPAAWVPRPEDYRQPKPSGSPPRFGAPGGRSNLPTVAGVLLILAAVVGMAAAVYNSVNLLSPADYATLVNNTSPDVLVFLQMCGLVSIWSQAMALIGGVMAIQRMNWKLTLVCAIFSLAAGFIFFLFFEASIIGFVGLIFVVMSRQYFVS